MSVEKWKELNGLALAYVGDGVYDLFIRERMIERGHTQPNRLHRATVAYVSAKAQAYLIEQMLAKEEFLLEEELLYFKRGRNAKSHTSAKNADITTYRIATGFEAMLGYLYLSGQAERLSFMMQWCAERIEERDYEKGQ